jgi:hypothetical protein
MGPSDRIRRPDLAEALVLCPERRHLVQPLLQLDMLEGGLQSNAQAAISSSILEEWTKGVIDRSIRLTILPSTGTSFVPETSPTRSSFPPPYLYGLEGLAARAAARPDALLEEVEEHLVEPPCARAPGAEEPVRLALHGLEVRPAQLHRLPLRQHRLDLPNPQEPSGL